MRMMQYGRYLLIITVLSMCISSVGAVTTGSIVACGDNSYGQCNVPAGNDFVAIDAGFNHNIALRADGTIVAWGDNTYDQCIVPYNPDYVAIAAGGNHNLGLRLGEATNPIVAWGDNSYGQCNVPPPDEFTNIGAGGRFSLAATVFGKVSAWGDDTSGQCTVPSPNNYMYITGGLRHTLATSYGMLAAWGDNSYHECDVPPGDDYIAISAGDGFSLAQHMNRSLVAWGQNLYGQCNIPGENQFYAFDAGTEHCVAVRPDGSLAAWGSNDYGQCNVPSGNTYFAVAGGYHHSIALKKSSTTDVKANFSADTVRGPAPLGVTFTSRSSGDPDTFLYDFGDGCYSHDSNPIHIYSFPGNYSVSLTVTGQKGSDTHTKVEYITVLAHPVERTTLVSVTSIPSGATVFIDGVATGTTKVSNNLYKVTEGVHSLKITKEGYRDWNGSFTVKWPHITVRTIKLQKAGFFGNGTWKFVVLGDSPDGAINSTTGISPNIHLISAAVAAEKPDLVIFTGDLISGWSLGNDSPVQRDYMAQFGNWMAAVSPIHDYSTGRGIPLYVARGNHEDGPPGNTTPLLNAYLATVAFGMPTNGPPGEVKLSYSFAHKGAKFIVIDEYIAHNEMKETVNQGWVNGQLTSDTRPFMFVVGHSPAYLVDDDPEDLLYSLPIHPEERDQFWQSLVRTQIPAYLCGHAHLYARGNVQGVEQVVSGNAGAPMQSFSLANADPLLTIEYPLWNISKQDQKVGYLVITVNETSRTWSGLEKHFNNQTGTWTTGDRFTRPSRPAIQEQYQYIEGAS
ncbi:MAG: metallophosphoesterase [Methanomicrobiales archaeon]|nr:metallophosphoesterase [Methanomicrobiales archaeon]